MNSKIKSSLKEAGWSAVKTVAVAAAINASVAYAVPAIGFTAGSITAGSLASLYQRKYLGGRISAFSVLRRVGVKGLFVATKVGMVAASATASGVYMVCKILLKKKERNENVSGKTNNEQEEISDSNTEEESDNIHSVTKIKHMEIDSEWEDISYPDNLTVANRA